MIPLVLILGTTAVRWYSNFLSIQPGGSWNQMTDHVQGCDPCTFLALRTNQFSIAHPPMNSESSTATSVISDLSSRFITVETVEDNVAEDDYNWLNNSEALIQF